MTKQPPLRFEVGYARSALCYDLSQDKQVQIPKQGAHRDRELQELVKKCKRPVALFSQARS